MQTTIGIHALSVGIKRTLPRMITAHREISALFVNMSAAMSTG